MATCTHWMCASLPSCVTKVIPVDVTAVALLKFNNVNEGPRLPALCTVVVVSQQYHITNVPNN